MKFTMRSVLAATTLFTLTACGAGDSHVVGKYNLDVDAMIAGMPQAAAMPAQAMEMMKKSLKGSVDLTADHKFTFQMTVPMMGEQTADGVWKLEGDTVSMTGKDSDGVEQTKKGTLKDGVLTVTETKGEQQMTMTFRK